MSRTVITNGTILPGDPEAPLLRGADVVVENGVIAAVGAGAADGVPKAGTEVIDAGGAIVMPGLIDTHMHMWEYAWRGTAMRKLHGRDYMKLLWTLHSSYDPDDTFDSTLGCGLAMIDHGITGVLDFLHGANQTEEHADAAVAAHRASGQRVLLCSGSREPYTAGRDVFESARTARLDDVARLRSGTEMDDLIEIGVALITPNRDNWDAFREDVATARALGARMSFHANEAGEFARMHRDGLLGPDIVPSHGNRASDLELRHLGEAGMVLSISPQTEIVSAKSPGVVNRAVRAGVTIAIGIDTPPSVLPLNLFGQLKMLFNSLQIFDNIAAREGARFPLDLELDPPSMSLERALATATANGGRALGRPGLGSVSAGSPADLIVVRPRIGEAALDDPAAYVVLSAPAADEVTEVLIGGVVRKRDGLLVGVGADAAERDARVRERVLRHLD
jgi:5-methylthioadenosine/S-adenosylhomocysteine deaminase